MTVHAFDAVLARIGGSPLSVIEAEVLAELWAHGDDGWLREDARFRATPWGRWIPAERYLVNDLLVHALRQGKSELSLGEQLDELSPVVGRPTAFCSADPRLRVDGDRVRLAPSELTAEPLLEDVGPLLQYVTHLPVVSLTAAAASEPAGEWGPGAEPQSVEPMGWLRVERLSRPLNHRMFVARVKGHSMNGGSRPIEDGAWVIFEFAFHEGVAYDPGTLRPTVLVRGDFSDPETGTYAVKQWDREAPEVRLVSANPDKLRFPDIVVPLDAADHLRVVAMFAAVLGAGDFARRPKPQRKPGRRVLEGGSGLAEQGERLGRRIDAFFAGEPAPEAAEDDAPLGDGWQTRVVCLAADAGGPHLEVGPLDGLPLFVKKLRALGSTGWDGLLLAANARQRPDRLPVRPGAGPWRWQAVGFEDEEDLGLERLAADALPAASVTVFRVDTDDVGQRQVGTTLALGQAYRLLLAPGLGEDTPSAGLADGWRLWSIDLGSPPSAATRMALQALGLSVGEAWPRLEWALLPPATWRTTPRGERYPVFEVGTEVAVQAHGLPGEDDEAAVLFLRGPAGTERLVLPRTDSAILSLGTLSPGRWACALLHPRAAIRSTTLLFEAARAAIRHVDAAWSVHTVEDFSTLELTAPPGWPVSLAWRVLGETPIATVHADSDSSVDISGVLPLVMERARRARVADLAVDLGELGRQVLPHDRRRSVNQVREALFVLWAQRQELVKTRAGAWLTLVPSWFRPVTELLGYAMEELPHDALPAADHGLAAWRLVVDERSVGKITRAVSRALVLTSDSKDVVGEALEWVDQACAAIGVREALVTDGVRWTSHRRGNRLRRRTWDIGEVLTQDYVEDMLADLAEGL